MCEAKVMYAKQSHADTLGLGFSIWCLRFAFLCRVRRPIDRTSGRGCVFVEQLANIVRLLLTVHRREFGL